MDVDSDRSREHWLSLKHRESQCSLEHDKHSSIDADNSLRMAHEQILHLPPRWDKQLMMEVYGK